VSVFDWFDRDRSGNCLSGTLESAIWKPEFDGIFVKTGTPSPVSK
jgi:hypothetical protein